MTPAPVGLRCPEHSGKPQGVRKITVAAERAATGVGSRRAFVVTMALIGINVTVYLVELAIGGSSGGTGNWIYNHGALVANGIYSGGQVSAGPVGALAPTGYALIGVTHGEWWRLVTSAFLHYGIVHLGVNMFSLYFAGRILEIVIGRWRFALLYLASAVAGSAGALYVTPNGPSAGASGAIFGVLGALLVLERRGTINSGGQILMWIVINLVITFSIPGISIGAHIGGLIAGIVVMLAFVRGRSSVPLSIAGALAVAAASVVFAYAVI
jgi:membrane associated rhomboid family serine protease